MVCPECFFFTFRLNGMQCQFMLLIVFEMVEVESIAVLCRLCVFSPNPVTEYLISRQWAAVEIALGKIAAGLL